MQALLAIRREKLLPSLYGSVVMAQSNFAALEERVPEPLPWLHVEADRDDVDLPARIAGAAPLEAATLRLALGIGASLVLLEEPIRQSAKLSAIKSYGAISILVQAHRIGLLSAVRPMVKALDKLGFSDVLPPPDQLDALWTALDAMREQDD